LADRLALSPGELGDCAFVIESVREDLKLKREIFNGLAVIASNASSIPISILQKGRRHPERFIGMH
jgi:3-hydroxybutyryl-CoA dehydrogenase